jgi:enoyl-CoA hydratase/carnithine racemase
MLQVGFLDHLVAPHNLDSFVNDYAQHIAGLAPLSVRAMKRILREAAVCSVDQALADRLVAECLGSHDLQEGFAAKREKRGPRFEGR